MFKHIFDGMILLKSNDFLKTPHTEATGRGSGNGAQTSLMLEGSMGVADAPSR